MPLPPSPIVSDLGWPEPQSATGFTCSAHPNGPDVMVNGSIGPT